MLFLWLELGGGKMHKVSEQDLAVITRQLGRSPQGVVGVAARCRKGFPQVIVNAPVRLEMRDGRVEPQIFPTLYWLTCPRLVAAVSQLEAEGLIARIQDQVDSNPELRKRLEAAHARTAKERVNLVANNDWAHLFPERWEVLSESGVGGIRGQGIKCLHTHYADYLAARDNPVGEIVQEELEKRGLLAEIQCELCASPNDDASPANGESDGRRAETKAAAEGIEGTALEGPTGRGTRSEKKEKIAVAKVGTNSVRMLVTERYPLEGSSGSALVVRDDVSMVTRIGRGVNQTGKLSEEGIQATLDALQVFQRRAKSQGASIVRLVGTSALRDAACSTGEQSTAAFAARLRATTGLALEVVSGEKEAQLSYRGAVYGSLGIDCDRGGKPSSAAVENPTVIVMDIGGGSTEVMGMRQGAFSFPIGAVRLSEIWSSRGGAPVGDAAVWQELLSLVRSLVCNESSVLGSVPQAALVGVGGTFTSLAAVKKELLAYSREEINGTRLTRDEIEELGRSLFAVDVLKRRQVKGMQPGREDIIPFGAAIAVVFMDVLGVDFLTASVDDMLLGMALEWYE